MAEAPALGRLLAVTRQRLAAAGIGDAAIEARLLVESATETGRMDAIRSPDRPVGEEAALRLEALVMRRLAGEPVHRILGHREFHGIDLVLAADTLEPRDDTEALIDLALRTAGKDQGQALAILDLGTGTGAIALALLAELPNARAVGTDIADGAVAAARANASRAGLADRFAAVRSDWFGDVAGRFDLIVSNPPYIPRGDIAGLAREVRLYDPLRALDGGTDGLDAYRAIAAGASAHLEAGGAVVVEIGEGQRRAVETIFRQSGFAPVDMARDLGGHERALAFRRSTGGKMAAK